MMLGAVDANRFGRRFIDSHTRTRFQASLEALPRRLGDGNKCNRSGARKHRTELNSHTLFNVVQFSLHTL